MRLLWSCFQVHSFQLIDSPFLRVPFLCSRSACASIKKSTVMKLICFPHVLNLFADMKLFILGLLGSLFGALWGATAVPQTQTLTVAYPNVVCGILWSSQEVVCYDGGAHPAVITPTMTTTLGADGQGSERSCVAAVDAVSQEFYFPDPFCQFNHSIPNGQFESVVTTKWNSAGIDLDGQIVSIPEITWESNDYSQLLNAGHSLCALASDGSVEVVPVQARESMTVLSTGNVEMLACGATGEAPFGCALQSDTGLLDCFGGAQQVQPPQDIPFLLIRGGGDLICGVRSNDTVVQCWGFSSGPEPMITFSDVIEIAVNIDVLCVIRCDRSVLCNRPEYTQAFSGMSFACNSDVSMSVCGENVCLPPQ
jgi:hypothetical protein